MMVDKDSELVVIFEDMHHNIYTDGSIVLDANPMVPAGYTISAPIINSKSFGSLGDKFVKEG